MNDNVVPRESKPTQADDWVFLAACWFEPSSLSLLSFSALAAACSAKESFPEFAGPFPKDPDKSPLNASPFEGVGLGLFERSWA